MTNGNNEEGEDPNEQEEDDDQSAIMLTGTSTADENGIIHSSAVSSCYCSTKGILYVT